MKIGFNAALCAGALFFLISSASAQVTSTSQPSVYSLDEFLNLLERIEKKGWMEFCRDENAQQGEYSQGSPSDPRLTEFQLHIIYRNYGPFISAELGDRKFFYDFVCPPILDNEKYIVRENDGTTNDGFFTNTTGSQTDDG